MSITRALSIVGLCFTLTAGLAAEATKDSPFGQAGATAAVTSSLDNIDFAGVSTVGNRTMINLYDKQQKRTFWVETGKPNGDFTVTKYDSAHDQITVRRNGTEKILPLRPPSAVVNGSSATAGVTPAVSGGAAAPAATTSTQTLSQARQEEEARMLVSDLLEIGMAQRKAYEEAQRRGVSGQSAPATVPATTDVTSGMTPTPAPTGPQPAPAQAAQPNSTTTPSS